MITIVTPTYNRVKELNSLYKSLCKQTIKSFDWLIIDDGSTDTTKDTVNRFIEDNPVFKIRYVYKKNGGKHTALNVAFREVQTELLFIVDSDDFLTPDAIETIFRDWKNSDQDKICGIGYLRGYDEKQAIGDLYPKEGDVDTFINVRYNQGIDGDKAEVWKTSCLKSYRYPEYEGERFISESVAWIHLAKNHPMLFRNQIIYITEYLAGGLSDAGRKLRFQCPKGMAYGSLETMSKEFSLKIRIKETLLYIVYSKFGRKSYKEILSCPYSALVTMCYLPGILLYMYWKRKYKC